MYQKGAQILVAFAGAFGNISLGPGLEERVHGGALSLPLVPRRQITIPLGNTALGCVVLNILVPLWVFFCPELGQVERIVVGEMRGEVEPDLAQVEGMALLIVHIDSSNERQPLAFHFAPYPGKNGSDIRLRCSLLEGVDLVGSEPVVRLVVQSVGHGFISDGKSMRLEESGIMALFPIGIEVQHEANNQVHGVIKSLATMVWHNVSMCLERMLYVGTYCNPCTTLYGWCARRWLAFRAQPSMVVTESGGALGACGQPQRAAKSRN
jgi:hypothetical protein